MTVFLKVESSKADPVEPIRLLIKQLLARMLRYFFPSTCPFCNEIANLDSQLNICNKCLDEIKFHSPPFCNSCGASLDTIFEECSKCLKEEKKSWENSLSVMKMEGIVRQVIISFKYQTNIIKSSPLAGLCAQKLIDSNLEIDIISYVPLHWVKFFRRGYNQSSLVAKLVSNRTNIPYRRLLKRTKNTISQAKLSGEKRRKNLKGAFIPTKGANLLGKNILLIDDVYTTGTTFRETVNALKSCSPNSVTVLSISRR